MPGPRFLAGDRVSLHTIEEGDIPFLQEMINHPDVRRYLARAAPLNGVQEREWFEEQVSDTDSISLLVVGSDGPAGNIGMHEMPNLSGSAEIGISLHPDHWGEKYGTAASRLLTDYAFSERRFHRLVARVLAPNEASKRIWEKLGYRHEAVHKEATFADGQYLDVHWYAVLEDEWRA